MASNGKQATVLTKVKSAKDKPHFDPYKKVKHEIPDLETLVVGKQYAFTYNPCDKYQGFNCVVTDRIREFYKHMDEFFGYKNFSNKKLWVELSPKGRLHLHGIIVVEQIVQFYLYEIPKLTRKGTVHIKAMTDDGSVWMEYCTKQHVLHQYIIDQLALPIPVMRLTETAFNLRKTRVKNAQISLSSEWISEEEESDESDHGPSETPKGFLIKDDYVRPLPRKRPVKSIKSKALAKD